MITRYSEDNFGVENRTAQGIVTTQEIMPHGTMWTTHKNTILHLQGNTRHRWGNDREEALVTILGHNLWCLVIPIIVRNNIKNHKSQCQYPSRRSKRNIPTLSAQCQYPSWRSKRNIPCQYPSRRSNPARIVSLVLVVNVNIDAVNGIE
jgi:hypothetical protein